MAHIDRLRRGNGQSSLERLAGVLPVAGTEIIRESPNDYHQRLTDAYSNPEKTSRDLRTLAHRDALTGAHNCRAFDASLQTMPGVLGERRISVCFALFDVNHFKAINDTYGHQVGDGIPRLMASCIDSGLRRGEQLFHLGDDSRRRIVEHLVAMISEIGHRMVAEGIEDEDIPAAARQAEFTLGQGYLFGRPSEAARRSDFDIDIDNLCLLSGEGGYDRLSGQYRRAAAGRHASRTADPAQNLPCR